MRVAERTTTIIEVDLREFADWMHRAASRRTAQGSGTVWRDRATEESDRGDDGGAGDATGQHRGHPRHFRGERAARQIFSRREVICVLFDCGLSYPIVFRRI